MNISKISFNRYPYLILSIDSPKKLVGKKFNKNNKNNRKKLREDLQNLSPKRITILSQHSSEARGVY
jgi:hypothetical protein